MASKGCKKFRYRYVVLALLGLFILGHNFYKDGIASQQIRLSDFSDSLSGNYLAGYIAGKEGDWEKAARLFEEAREKDPLNPTLLESSYTLKLLSGDLAGAISLAKQYPSIKPHSVISHILLAADALKQKKYTKAEEILRSVKPLGENDEPVVGIIIVPFLVAWTKAGQEAYDDALLLFDSMENTTNKEVIHYHKALIYDLVGNKNAAKYAYESSLQGSIQPYHFIKAASGFYLRNDMPEKAEALYLRYQAENPTTDFFAKPLEKLAKGMKPKAGKNTVEQGFVEILMEAVRIAYQNELYTEAMAYLQIIRYLDMTYPQSIILLSNHYEDKGDYSKANYFYSLIDEGSDFYNKTQINIARNLYLMGKKEKAEQMLRELTEVSPKSYAAPLELADLLREDERYATAADVYAQVIARIPESKPQHWYIFYTKGISHERASEWKEAEVALLKALELNPGHPDVLNYLGYSWLVMDKNVKQAKQMIETAVAARPNDAHIMDSMGWALFHMGDYHKAVDYLEQAVEIMPYDYVMNEHLGDVYWQVGRKNEARFQWQRAVDGATDEINKQRLQKKLEEGIIMPEGYDANAAQLSQNLP